jgi:hypothetical protein
LGTVSKTLSHAAARRGRVIRSALKRGEERISSAVTLAGTQIITMPPETATRDGVSLLDV